VARFDAGRFRDVGPADHMRPASPGTNPCGALQLHQQDAATGNDW
jgi:hypothetical protein